MKNVLVTGANGFIGSHLVEHLLQNNCNVVAAVNRRTDLLSDLGVEVIVCDVTTKGCLKNVPNIDTVYHLASLTEMNKFHSNVDYGKKVNVEGTRSVIESLKSVAKKFIYISTLGVYGNAKNIPINESEKPRPLEPYAASKLEGEKVTISLCQKYGIKYVVARLFNCYGERQKKNFLIPSLIMQTLNSNRVYVGNTAPTRDFIYVKDVVEALFLLGEKDSDEIYNVGTGKETTVGEVASMLIDISGRNVEVVKDESKFKDEAIEVFRSCADISKIKALGWSPKYLLRDGLSATYQYYKNDRNASLRS